ncbi:class I SAM-dependent methyltransferase [Methanolobus halotolerans]|uniref:Class I SAM-dependent methyltransferase n=1 Tax=Methanolobus halotolerans TaxID=2052935 RepID=A0A4E0PVH6_9EURY|nr:class I SAM-dependent methyltransferase [Methanolobus halotolerans]TGC08047.1 class I SAM-dependent methyltransferase [Methanolobus halotolerans]
MNAQDIDWNDVWAEQMRKHLESGNKKECASIWEDKENAKRFWEMSQKDGQKRARITIASLSITPDSKVLDIGAGPGSLAIPISEKVSYVTAVEPSSGMVEVLQENIEEQGSDNITVIRKRWEDIDTEKDLDGPYDVIIASFSLGMPDIRKAIEDMQAVSCGYIYLYWFAGDTTWDSFSREIWPELHGSEYFPNPKCDVLYNVLYNMGIYPDMQTFKLEHTENYPTIDEAVNNLSSHFSLATNMQRKTLSDYLEHKLERENGNFKYHSRSTRVKIWWKTNSEKKKN